jgi:general secretion pathway protein G
MEITMDTQAEGGFSLIELLIVVMIIGILAAIAIPGFMDAVDRSKQRRSMGDMRTIVTANGTYFVDNQIYAPTLNDLVGGDYLQRVILDDAWGNALIYNAPGPNYDLTSLGSDGAAGPAAPATWINDPFDPDIIVRDGAFAQAPSG